MSRLGNDDFTKIERKLKQAKKFLSELENCTDTTNACLNWENFISCWNQTQKLLHKFCRLVGLSGITQAIQDDTNGAHDCAEYLLKARNAEEHSFKAVVREIPERRFVSVPGPVGGVFPEGSAMSSRNNIIVIGNRVFKAPDYEITPSSFDSTKGLPAGSKHGKTPSYIIPVPIFDQGKLFDPPFLDVDEPQLALAIGQRGIEWIEGHVDSACDELGWVRSN